MRAAFAELLGTFILVFAGTGAIVINQEANSAIGHAGIALTFGLVVFAMIQTFGDLSGAHLNPAVSLAFTANRSFPLRKLPAYLTAQSLGALAASATLHFLFPSNLTLGSTQPSGSASQSFILEAILSAILMLVILRSSTGSREKGLTAGLAIGATVGLAAMFAGPVCGASMNPARSLGPALVSGQLQNLALYLVAPCLGTLTATLIHHWLQPTPSNHETPRPHPLHR